MSVAAQLPDGDLFAVGGLAGHTDAWRGALDAALLAAHAAGDRTALVGLYAEAAETAAAPAVAFYLTHAHVYALEAGDPRAAVLKTRLVEIGADMPDAP